MRSHNRSNDTMANMTETIRIMETNCVKPVDVFIDDISVGRGIPDRLQEIGYGVSSGGDVCFAAPAAHAG